MPTRPRPPRRGLFCLTRIREPPRPRLEYCVHRHAVRGPSMSASEPSRLVCSPAAVACSRWPLSRVQSRRCAAPRRGRRRAPPPAAVTILTLAAEADRAGVGLHRDAAVAALDDDPAGGRGHRHADLREVGRSRARRHAARADRPREAAGGGAQHRGAAAPGAEADVAVLAPAGQAARVAGQGRRDQPAGVRAGAELAPDAPRPSWPRSTRRCAKDASSCSTTASTRRRPASSATFRFATAIASRRRRSSRRSTRTARSRPTSRCRSIARRSCALGLPVQMLDADGKVVATNPITFVAPRVDEATQTVLVKSLLRDVPPAAARRSSSSRARIVWRTARRA